MTRLFAAASVLVLLFVGGCTPTMSLDVTRFSSVPGPLAGQSFTILPERQQVGSLEFQRYAELVAAQLARHGLVPVAADESRPADLAVLLRYGPAGARSEIVSGPGPGSSFGMWQGGFGPGYGYGLGGSYPFYDNSVTTNTVYAQTLEVEMVDGPAWRAGTKTMLFQGRAVGESAIRDVNTAMPYLVEALFQDFPGRSGQTVRVSLPIGG